MKSETTEYKICHTKKNDSKIQKNFLTQSCIEFLEKNVNKSSSTIQSYAEKYSNYISQKKSKDLSVASDDFYTNLNTLFPELFTIPFPYMLCLLSRKKSRKDHSAIYQLLYSLIMNMFIP